MKALRYVGPQQLSYEDAPDPVPAQGEVVVAVHAVGICGSDMHAYRGHDERRPAPLTLGHEAAGIVLEGAHKGRRVTINPLVTCGRCSACVQGRTNLCAQRKIISMPPMEGAFAEYVAIAERNLTFVPEHVSLEKAALAEPIACGWHAVRIAARVLSKPLSECRCHVIGGGAIGVGAALVLAEQGATQISVGEPNPGRRTALGNIVSATILGEDLSSVEGADLIIDAVGIEATRADAFRLVAPGGVIMHIGLGNAQGGVDARRATLQEITFVGTYTYTDADFQATAQALFDGRLGALDWAQERPLASGAQAFSDIFSGAVCAPKIILKP